MQTITKLLLAGVLFTGALSFAGCGASHTENVGEARLAVVLSGGAVVNTVSYTVSGPGVSMMGTVDVSHSTTVSAVLSGLPAGGPDTVGLTATSVDGSLTCSGTSAPFMVTAHQTTSVTVMMDCHQAPHTGSVLVNGAINICPVADGISANPADIAIGQPVALTASAHDSDNGPQPLSYHWSAPTGSFGNPSSATTTFTCNTQGPVTLTVTVSDGDTTPGCADTATATIMCEPGNLLVSGSLVISSTTYDHTQGPLASLTAGVTKLAGATAMTPSTATAGNAYPAVWGNAGVDSSFGVTSAIQITDFNPSTSTVLSQVTVPPSQVATSFSSKSELGLHITTDMNGPHLVFVGYAGAGVGSIDVSNSDAVAGQDLTNLVTGAFGPTYAFARTIVKMDNNGTFAYTPTINYGGNNGRAALLGSNGLYYSVGNANNGSATVFGAGNMTNPDVTETTGLEVVTPINGATSSVAIPPNNSAQVDPLIQYTFVAGKPDKPGKDNNYRGIAEFGGALYFTKGSGSNGVDTVYTVPNLPTIASAPAAHQIGIVPGFPTDSAKATGGNFTPFAIYFANATTMYVSDEASGNTTDTTMHAGLQKWTLSGGMWTLQYVLTQGLIGTMDASLNGADGAYPATTTVGLRNLTGSVNGDAVTLYATTSTSSLSGDQGADPNKVVTITDSLSATTLPAAESFSVVMGPTYGVVYRGVALVP
jgi:hypothetical protein